MPAHSTTKNSNTPLTWICTVSALAVLSALAFVTRFLHLLKGDHYYILSPDSYFFHWQADRALSGEPLFYRWHSGLSYPLAWSARVLKLVFGTSETEALRWAGLLWPPILGVLAMLVLYVLVARLYSRRAALFAAFTWAIALMPVFVTSAGYLDRDGVSILLVLAGVLMSCISRKWHLRVKGVEIGWVVGVLAVLAVEALLYSEWMFMGPLLLTVIIGAWWMAEVAIVMVRNLYRMAMKRGADILDITITWLRDIPPTLWHSDWRGLAVLLLLNFLAVAIIPPGIGSVFETLSGLTAASLAGTHAVAELQGMSLSDLTPYHLLLLPALVGLYIAMRRGRKGDAIILGWFVSLFAIGLFSRRVFLFAAPSVCALSGVGLASLVDFGDIRLLRGRVARAVSYDQEQMVRFLAVGCGLAVIFLSVVVSLVGAYNVGSGQFISADNDWEAGMAWLREYAPTDAVVMTHWNYGYFILDLADRRPVADNGMYTWTNEKNRDIALAYCTTEPSEAVSAMQKYEARYLVFSKLDCALLPVITQDGLGESYGDGKTIPPEMRDSLYARALSGRFTAGEGLSRVYPEGPALGSAPLVILALE